MSMTMKYDNKYGVANKTETAGPRKRLARYFDVSEDIFLGVPSEYLAAWAARLPLFGKTDEEEKRREYKITSQEYNFLIGRGWR